MRRRYRLLRGLGSLLACGLALAPATGIGQGAADASPATEDRATNATILAVEDNLMRDAQRNGTLPGDRAMWMERFRLLTRAWFAGAFGVQRFFARKPGIAGR